MNTIFLYPSNPLNINQIDENFKEEYEAAKKAGLTIYLIDVDALEGYKNFQIPKNSRIIFRGWMLNETMYIHLERLFSPQLITLRHN